MGNPARNSTRGVLKASVVLIALSLVIQLAILPSEENLAAASITAATSLMTFFYLFGRPLVMVRYPLSALGLLGLSVSSLSGPLVYQSVVLTPITANLANPIRTFAYIRLLQLTLIASHMAYSQECSPIEGEKGNLVGGTCASWALQNTGITRTLAPRLHWTGSHVVDGDHSL